MIKGSQLRQKMRSDLGKYRITILVSLLITIPLGFYTKFHEGILQEWVNNSLGGVFYEIFWILLIVFIFPRISPRKSALSVLIVTCLLEILQLWHPPFLELLRSSFIGRTILGNCFTWSDFPYYIIGSFFGWLLLIKIKKAGIKN